MVLSGNTTTTFGTTVDDNPVAVMRDKNAQFVDARSPDDSLKSNSSGNVIKLPPAVIPSKMKCTECATERVPQDMWWCRTCLKAICIQCNLLKGHTEHRSSPWTMQEVAQSLINAVELRHVARHCRAADEEIAIREFMAEVENYFLTKLHNLLDEKEEDDETLKQSVCDALKYDAKLSLPADAASAVSPPILAIHGIEDGKLERVLQEVQKLTNLGDAFKHSTATSACSRGGGNIRPQTPTPSTNRLTATPSVRRSFSILPDMPPDDFARMLEDTLASEGWNKRSRANSVDLVLRSGTPIELVYETTSTLSPAPEQQLPLMTSTPPAAASKYSPQPVEPRVTVVNGSMFNKMLNGHNSTTAFDAQSGREHDRLGKNRARPEEFDAIDGHHSNKPTNSAATNTNGSSVQLMVSEDTQTGGSVLTSATQTETHVVVSLRDQSTTPTSPNAPRILKMTENGVVVGVSPQSATTTLRNTVTPDRHSLPGDNASSASTSASDKYNVTAFYFGHDYLTRPIDICILPPPGNSSASNNNNRLAVSDSCGGVYVTTRDGDVIHQIWTEGGSASSLCYSSARKELLIGVMKKQGRTVQAHNANNYELVESIPCPVEPEIELTRSRWIAVNDRGEIYIASGDNRLSALWKYNRSTKNWLTLKLQKGTRYQYLTFMHEETKDNVTTLTLLTCEGVHGGLILFTVRQNRIVAEQAFNRMYDLNNYIRSPASAVLDESGNILILDYANGKLWLLTASSKNGRTGRHLKVLLEVGAQEGMGVAAGDGWCYVACLNKKRIQAMKYLDVQ